MQNWCSRRNSLRSESFQAKKTDEHNHCILTASNLFPNNYNRAKMPAVLLPADISSLQISLTTVLPRMSHNCMSLCEARRIVQTTDDELFQTCSKHLSFSRKFIRVLMGILGSKISSKLLCIKIIILHVTITGSSMNLI